MCLMVLSAHPHQSAGQRQPFIATATRADWWGTSLHEVVALLGNRIVAPLHFEEPLVHQTFEGVVGNLATHLEVVCDINAPHQASTGCEMSHDANLADGGEFFPFCCNHAEYWGISRE